MINILREQHIDKTRKPHKCSGCLRTFDPPVQMTLCVTAQDGTAYNGYFCSTCEMIRNKRSHECSDGFFEFSEGDLLEEALEIESDAQKIVDAYKETWAKIKEVEEWYMNYSRRREI